MPMELIDPLMQFGVAGLMGALWVWERTLSRKREAQLDAAHQRLVRQRDEMNVLMTVVQRNAVALERLDQTQNHLRTLLEKMSDEMHKVA